MNAAIKGAYDRYHAAIRALHDDIKAVYPIGSRVRMGRGNHVRLGTVTEVSCHFIRVQFDDRANAVWKNVNLHTIDPA